MHRFEVVFDLYAHSSITYIFDEGEIIMEKNNQSSFGEMLKAFRKLQGLTQQQLARKLAMHQNTIGAWERGNYLPATRAMILEVARCLRLDEVETHHLLEAGLTTATSHWNVPYQRNSFFTGHQNILQKMHAILTKEQNVNFSHSCVLSGMPGIGKTQAAIEYAYQHALDYSAIFWMSAETEESITSSFVAMATTLKLPLPHLQAQKQVITIIHNWLMSHHNWLLIFDNVEHVELVKRFLPISREGSLLFTTRRPTLGTLASCLELSQLSLKESVHLLLRRAGSQLLHISRMAVQDVSSMTVQDVSSMTVHADEEQSVRNLAVALGGLPLALEQAAAYIEESQCSFSHFLHLFQQDAMHLLQEHPSSVLYPHSVAKAFTLAFEQLQQDSPVAADLLLLYCFLAPDKIPEELLLRSMSHLRPELQATLSNPLQLNSAFKDVLTYALLQRNTREKTLRVHRLIQIILKEKLSDMAKQARVEQLIRMMNQLFLLEQDRLDVEHWAWYEQLLPHAQAVTQAAEHWPLFSLELGSLLSKIAMYLFHRARYEQAEAFYLRAISVQEQVLGTDHPDLIVALAGLASTQYQQGKYHAGEVFYQRAISLVKVHLRPEHFHCLAWLAYKEERYAEAEVFIACALSFHGSISSSDHGELATTLHLKANIYRAQGKYKNAELLYQGALSLYRQALEADHIDIALLMSDFAKLYLCQAQWEEAEQFYQEALRLWERFQELDHPDYASCLESYAQLLRQQQEWREADVYIQRAREIQIRHYVTSFVPFQEGYLPAHAADERDAMRFARRKEEDFFETFLQQCCVLSTQSTCRASELWQAYQKWVQTQENALPLSRQAFSFRLKMKGCSQARTNAHRIWRRIELKGGQKSHQSYLLANVGSHAT
jgi:tetratricopeptide (TPR) repeat protein/transcriptional regulator with XRE-family HTH domain